MLFPENAKICDGLNCPIRDTGRTKGICIQRQQNEFIKINSNTPSILILFSDPTIRYKRPVPFILKIKSNVNETVTSRLFGPYTKYLLPYIPDNEIIYLDNFFRCQASSTDELSNNFMKNSHPFAQNCYENSKILFNNLNLKCLIISRGKILIWLGQKGLLYCNDSKIMKYINDYKWDHSNRGNFTILLNECFTLKDYGFPVFYFPYPTQLNARYDEIYDPDPKYHLHCDKIKAVLEA